MSITSDELVHPAEVLRVWSRSGGGPMRITLAVRA